MKQPTNTAKPKKKWYRRKWLWIIGAIFVIVVATSGGDSAKKNNNDKNTSGTQSSELSTKEEAFAFDDGKHEVGKAIQPGTYRTRGVDASNFSCYWARLKDFSGELEAIIANSGSYDKGPQVVTIAASDKAFETRGCGKWYAELTQVTDSTTIFGAGTMIVGTDIVPGTYKNSGGTTDYSCYWARLSGFTGELSDIISNENSKNTIVTIAPADKGFVSSGCGTWTKQ